jgi:predicted NAD/FAD-binding protein
MLSVGDSPQWRTVVGGSATYVEAVARHTTHVRRGCAVTSVSRDEDGVTVTSAAGPERFDRVVLATHADEALDLLADPSPEEKEVLGAFGYSRNETVLHRDPSLLPRARQARASWNYLTVPDGEAGGGPVVTYWMGRLQGLPEEHPLLVTLNATARVDPGSVVAVMDYTHPVYDLESVAAQRRLPGLSTGRTAYAGAYHGWGFHEDGCRSGVEAAAAFGVTW